MENKGALKVSFGSAKAELIAPNGTVFDINKSGCLYYLNCSINSSPKVCSNKDKHQIISHCNAEDLNCYVCVMGKMPQLRYRKPDYKAKSLFE